MNKEEVVIILEDLAENDLSADSDIYDHPCSVAIRVINGLSDDLDYLRGTIKGENNIKCKRGQTLLHELKEVHY